MYKKLTIILFSLILFSSIVGLAVASGQNTSDIQVLSGQAYESLIRQYSEKDTKALMKQAETYLGRGKKQEAMVLYMIEMNRKSDNLDQKGLANHVQAFIAAGDIYYADGNYPSALGTYMKGLKVSEAVPSKPLLQVLYKKMGNVYALSQDYEKAIIHYKRGLDAPQVDSDERYKTLQNIIGAYFYLDSIPQAKRYYEMALSTPHEITPESMFMQDFTLALILSGEGQRATAVDIFEKLAKQTVADGLDTRYEASCYEEISKCYLADEQYDIAIEYMERCRSTAESHNQLHMFAETLKTLSSLYDRIGQTDLSLRLKSRYLEIKDSIFNVREFDNVRNQQFIYEMEKVDDRISELNREMERKQEMIGWQQTIIIVIVVALAIILVSLFMLFRSRRKLSHSYASLYRINKESAAEQARLSEANRRLRHETSEQKVLIQELTGRLSATIPPSEQTPAKYCSSNLDSERRNALADAVADVMENTEEFCDPDFSLDRLAKKVESNPKYVSQVINEVYGKNFSNFVNHYRIRTAATRLADQAGYGHLTIKAIGDSVGYRSATTFINAFRKINGMTPSIYQKMVLADSANHND